MGFFLPALLLGGFGVSQHLASKELDDLIREAEQPLFGFWWGAGLGFVAGIWCGYNLSPLLKKFREFTKAGLALFSPGLESQEMDAEANRRGEAQTRRR